MNITIIGIGRLGGALALALSEKGYRIENLVARDTRTADRIMPLLQYPPTIMEPKDVGQISSEIILITTPDAGIESAAQNLAEKITHQSVVLHTSGSLSSEILRTLTEKNCPTGSLHPLVSVSDPEVGARRFADTFFCIEGHPEAVKIAEKLVADLSGRSFSIDTRSKALYHASAVTACGHLVALIDIAVEMMVKCGLDQAEAQAVLLPLIRSTVENLDRQSPAEALTGTFARADSDTFERHIDAIGKMRSAEVLSIYLQLGERSLDLAEKNDVDPEKLTKMRKILSLAKKNPKC